MLKNNKVLITLIFFLLIIISIQVKIFIEIQNREDSRSVIEQSIDEWKNLPSFFTTKEEVQLKVPFIQQKPELDRGCEVTSLAMLLQFYGYDVSKMELYEKIDKVPFYSNNYYGDMREGFVGNMKTFNEPGLGVYYEPIAKLTKSYTNKLVNLSDKSMSAILRQVSKGRPVWVITNTTYKKLDDSFFQTWKTKNGEMKVTYKMHAVVITGYDENYIYINDPLANEENKQVAKKDFEEAFVQMGSQALTIKN